MGVNHSARSITVRSSLVLRVGPVHREFLRCEDVRPSRSVRDHPSISASAKSAKSGNDMDKVGEKPCAERGDV